MSAGSGRRTRYESSGQNQWPETAEYVERGTVRVGIDVTEVARVEASLATFGTRYTDRLFTSIELEDCEGPGPSRARGLAGRFAAKEATLKVLRVVSEMPRWTEIEVVRQPGGWPVLCLHGLALTLAEREGLEHWAVSITHETQIAAAVVVASSSGRRTDQGMRGTEPWKRSSVGF